MLDQVATSLDSDPQALDSHGVSLCRDAVRMGLRHDGRLDGGRKRQKRPRNAMLVGSVLDEIDSLADVLADFPSHLVRRQKHQVPANILDPDGIDVPHEGAAGHFTP